MTENTTTIPTSGGSIVTVRSFLDALASADLTTASDLITDDIAWHNTSLPTVRGKSLVRKILAGLGRPSFGFDVVIHHIATDGDVVLTERTDILRVGPVAIDFWVCGTFHLRDGRIAVWDDHFSPGNVALGVLRGTVRAVTGR
ncbi:limonene-1,2-epoxide hydrolase family protein [Rhodococcus sp. (in: high G+C Gram-positive bacteria)]|uniref:limonene-1,2-epoxide hydrolase family protein n=1 Tax=Rhodococcus sp. TaxID=1831 RepID=UPI0038906153